MLQNTLKQNPGGIETVLVKHQLTHYHQTGIGNTNNKSCYCIIHFRLIIERVQHLFKYLMLKNILKQNPGEIETVLVRHQ